MKIAKETFIKNAAQKSNNPYSCERTETFYPMFTSCFLPKRDQRTREIAIACWIQTPPLVA
jgi:hypothetical protein